MQRPGRWSHLASLSVTVATTVALSMAGAGTAQGADGFYQTPEPLPSADNGDVLRSEPSDFFLDPLKAVPARAEVQRIMYRSTDTHGDPMAVTGTVLTPEKDWTGSGERPLIGYAVGTQGIGDDCAPSKTLATGQQYEGPFLAGLLKRGYGVVVTDYESLGTPGVHTYVNRASQGHAVLDAIRAAQQLPEAHLPDDGPVATSGYSQGGGASASAAELQPDYAPELDLKGAYAGAVPADLAEVGVRLDGSYAAGLLGFALAGIDAAYPELAIPDILNEQGQELLQQIKDDCVTDIGDYAFTDSTDLTADGRPLAAYLDEEPYASRVAEQSIGERRPAAPVLATHSAVDDIVPYDQARQMARSWCEQGATVQFSTYPTPTHVATAPAAFGEAFAFLEARFGDLPARDNCGAF